MKIRLTYPTKQHALEDLRPLYEEFRTSHAQVYRRWRQIEAKDRLDGLEELREVSLAVFDFLKQRTDWETHSALVGAWADFRRLLQADMCTD